MIFKVNKDKCTTNVKKNYIYNLVYQIFSLLTPIILMPYLSRVLGSAGIGQYSFSLSIASYFILLGAFGFGYYAQRIIAQNKGNKKIQSICFWEILICKLLTVGSSLLVFLIILLCGVFKDYNTLMYLLIINIGANIFDITFFFQGNEEFGIIALRNIVIKVFGIILIFIFVRTSQDLWIYALCQGLILIGSNLSLWPSMIKRLTKVSLNDINFSRHFIPSFKLFIPTIAISIYTMVDRSFIGLLVPGTVSSIGPDGTEIIQKVSDIENGMYEQSEKMVKMVMTVITSLSIVMIPRNSNVLAKGNNKAFIENINKALRFVCFLGFPIMFGLAAVAINFSPWFYGNGYEKVPYLMMIFSLLIIIIGVSNVLGLQYLIPKCEDGKFTIAVVSGSIINIVLNVILIPYIKSYGAAIASVVSELSVTLIILWMVRKDIKFYEIIKMSWKYLLSGVIMFGFVFLTQYYLSSSILNTFILVFEGIVIYVILLIVLRDSLIIKLLRRTRSFLKNIFIKTHHKQ